MSTAVEVEAKYEIPAVFALPDLGGLPGVASIVRRAPDQLEAVYFDTPDLRLGRGNITLRRRTGGCGSRVARQAACWVRPVGGPASVGSWAARSA